MSQEDQQSSSSAQHKMKPVRKHIFSFMIMILLTAAAFYLVATNAVRSVYILPFIIFFAIIQVLLQLFTFMHLNEKGTGFYTLFILIGIFIATISALGILLM